MAMFFYDGLFIMFQERVDVTLRLSLELAVLIISGIICFLFLRKLPSGQLEVLFEESHVVEASQPAQKPKEVEVEIEMVDQADMRKMEAALDNPEPTIQPDLLL
jgi:hypothetical protein